MEYDQSFLQEVEGCGALAYPVSKMVNILDITDKNDIEKFTIDFNNLNSVVRIAYNKGRDIADYIIDRKLYQMAKDGDLKAMENFSFRIRQLSKST